VQNKYRHLLKHCNISLAFVVYMVIFTSCNEGGLGGLMEWPSYVIVYHANDGSNEMTYSTRRYGTAQNLEANFFVRIGHEFAGWARTPDGKVEFTDRQSVVNLATGSGETIHLFAMWDPIVFTVVYDANGGIGGNMKDSLFRFDGTGRYLRVNDFIHPASEIFLGWGKSRDGLVKFRDGEFVGNLAEEPKVIVLYARWGSGVFDVAFCANGGEGTVPSSSLSIMAGMYITSLPYGIGLYRAGFVFGGWNVKADGTGTNFNAGDKFTPSGDITLYAKWMHLLPGTVSITGIPQVGQTLAANTVNLGGTGTIYHQWLRGTLPISGATSSTYLIHPADIGHTIAVIVTRAGNLGSVTSTAVGPVPVHVSVPGNNLAAQLEWIRNYAVSDTNYIIELNRNEFIAPQTLTVPTGRNNVTITLQGIGAMRTVSLSATGSLFTVGSSMTLVLGSNVTLVGRRVGGNGNANNTQPLIRVYSGGTLMNAGARITGNTNTANNGGGVDVQNGGIFTMHDGEISGNAATHERFGLGGGVVASGGTFNMYGGIISNNVGVWGGGVCVSGILIDTNMPVGGTFNMRGGTIFGNTSRESGGGVMVIEGGVFRMSHGVIYGSNASAELRNTALTGAALANSGTAWHGTFNAAGDFIPAGTLITTNNTIDVSVFQNLTSFESCIWEIELKFVFCKSETTVPVSGISKSSISCNLFDGR